MPLSSLFFALLISLNHVPNLLPEPLSNDMKTNGKCAGDIDTDIKDGNAVDENIDDAKMTLTRWEWQRSEYKDI